MIGELLGFAKNAILGRSAVKISQVVVDFLIATLPILGCFLVALGGIYAIVTIARCDVELAKSDNRTARELNRDGLTMSEKRWLGFRRWRSTISGVMLLFAMLSSMMLVVGALALGYTLFLG